MNAIGDSVDVVLLPGGFVKAGSKPPRELYGPIVDEVAALPAAHSRQPVVCLGVDGRVKQDGGSRDQFALAVSPKGLIALGRKFHPTSCERGRIYAAESHLCMEEGFSRTFERGGKRFFLAVCYDAFGAHQKKLVNLGVDAILDLIHTFYPKGDGGQGRYASRNMGLPSQLDSGGAQPLRRSNLVTGRSPSDGPLAFCGTKGTWMQGTGLTVITLCSL